MNILTNNFEVANLETYPKLNSLWYIWKLTCELKHQWTLCEINLIKTWWRRIQINKTVSGFRFIWWAAQEMRVPTKEMSILLYLDVRWLSLEDDLWWKTVFVERQPLMEDNQQWKKAFNGGWPSIEYNIFQLD